MKHYSYSPHFGMEYHPDKEIAKAAAEEAVRIMSADPGYTAADMAQITWGDVTERATSTGAVGYALKRQDRLTYEAVHPQVINGRMENGNGDLVRVENIKERDLLEHDMVLSIACIWLPLSAMIARFKLHTFTDITKFVDLLFESYNVTRGGSEGNMTFTTFDRKFKLVLAIQKTIGLGPELLIARQKLLDAVDEYPDEANDLKTIVLSFLFPTDGQVRVAQVLSLRAYKLNNPLWNEGMMIIDKAIEVVSSKRQIRLYVRNEQGEYDAVPLSIAAL